MYRFDKKWDLGAGYQLVLAFQRESLYNLITNKCHTLSNSAIWDGAGGVPKKVLQLFVQLLENIPKMFLEKETFQ